MKYAVLDHDFTKVYVTWDHFNQLDKVGSEDTAWRYLIVLIACQDMAVAKTQMSELKVDVKDLGKKADQNFDHLILLLLSGFLLKEGFDWYRDERKGHQAEVGSA